MPNGDRQHCRQCCRSQIHCKSCARDSHWAKEGDDTACRSDESRQHGRCSSVGSGEASRFAGNATATDEKEALLRVASMWTDVVAQAPADLVKFLTSDAKQIHEQENYPEMLEIVVQKRLASAGQS